MTPTRQRPPAPLHALILNSSHPPRARPAGSSKSKAKAGVRWLALLFITHSIPHVSKYLLHLLHILGKHACVKDENEAMAGEDDRLQLHRGSDLGGQGKMLLSPCSTWYWLMQMTDSANILNRVQTQMHLL